MVDLSPRQQDVLDLLRANPTAAPIELARSLDLALGTVNQHLNALAKKGAITIQRRGRGRTPVLQLAGHGVAEPIVWRSMSEPAPESLNHGEVLLIAWWDGLDRRVEVWEGSAWSDVLLQQGPSPLELAEFGPYAWCVVKVPAGPNEAAS